MGRRSPGVGAALLVSVAACSTSSSNSRSGSSGSSSGTVTVLYSNNYVFNSDALATQWWNGIAKQWKTKHPHIKLILEGTGGTSFAGSGYLDSLNSFVQSPMASSSWPTMPASVQNMSTIDGKVYAINAGNNNAGLLYNKAMLIKAGVTMPWNPTNWAQILQVAAKVKAANPGVWPLWVAPTWLPDRPTCCR